MRDIIDQYSAMVAQSDGIRQLFALVSLCSARLIAAMLVMPPTNPQRMPGMSRMGLPVWIGMFIAWGQPADLLHGMSINMVAVLMLKETLLGFIMGYAAGTVFWVAEGVGSMIDNLAGYNNVQQSNPNSSDQSTPVGSFFSEMAMFAFFSLGGMTAFIGVVLESYAWWPLDRVLPGLATLLERFAQLELGGYMAAIARLAAPALFMLTLIDLGIGLLTKAAEKLEPNGLSQPVKGAATMVLLSLIIAVFFDQLRGSLSLVGFSNTLRSFFPS